MSSHFFHMGCAALTTLLLWMLVCLGLTWTLFPFGCVGAWMLMISMPCRSFGLGRRWLWWIALFGMIRFGEATNPGPAVHFEAQQFTLGSFNPSGLRNKSTVLSASSGVWGLMVGC